MKIEGHVKHWGDDMRSLNYLVTGPIGKRQHFASAVWPDVIDSRKQTTRFRVFLCPEDTPEGVEAELIEAAKSADVTLQRLVDVGPSTAQKESHNLGDGASVTVGYRQEEYPVVHLGTHGKRWGE